MAKGEPKTMRFAVDVEDYINQFDGNNFSEKFHLMVRWFRACEDEKKRKIELLDKQIKQMEKRLNDLNEVLFNVSHLERHFKGLQQSIDSCRGYLEHFLQKDLENVLSSRKLEKLA